MDGEKDIFQERKESLSYGMGKNPIQKAYGVTVSEHKLVKLAEKSFLSLWSYPNLFIDKGGYGTKGQEFCDLLIVFENHVLIFSDKDIDYPQISDHELAWKRWFKRAVMKSADQIYGAERWLRQYPDRIFLDKACKIQFPLDFPAPENMILHRIVVAHGASKWCKQVLGGTGSLMIDPKIIGENHYGLTPPMQPFVVGQVNPEKGFVHIFDDTTLEVILGNLDTIADFASYLTKKEKFIATGKLLFAAGEDELLAYYLKQLNDQQEHDFVFDQDFDTVSIDEGIWSDLQNHPQWKLKKEANKVSYFWDELIEKFNTNILNDTQYFTKIPGIKHSEQIIRFMAKENRVRRRLLSESFFSLIDKTPPGYKATRVTKPSKPGEPFYVFLLLPKKHAKKSSDYREVRFKLLEAYCLVAKLVFPELLDVIGIATESENPGRSGEDALYFDAREWSPELESEAKNLQNDLQLLTNITMHSGRVKEYPDSPQSGFSQQKGLKGRDRNLPCPCGSGKKYKHCCGR